jgi:hypothetical protein
MSAATRAAIARIDDMDVGQKLATGGILGPLADGLISKGYTAEQVAKMLPPIINVSTIVSRTP